MADTSIHKPIVVKGWTISPSGDQWRAVNKLGQVGFASGSQAQVESWAKTTSLKATKDMNKQ